MSQWPPYAGYPLHLFTSAVDDEFRCIRCRQVLRAPLELSCEHLICRSCYSEPSTAAASPSTSAAASAFKCPVCHALVTELPHLNKPVQSLIQKLVITCPYRQYGCQHTGPIGKDDSAIDQHLLQCMFAPTLCDGCGSEVQRRHKQHHDKHDCLAGKWQCQFCDEWVAKDDEDSASHRTNTFDRSLLCCHLRPCPNACTLPKPASASSVSTRPHKRQREEETDGETKEAEPSLPSTAGLRSALPFWQMAAHVPVCPLGPVTCALCSTDVQRRDLVQHFASSHPLKAVRIEIEARKAEEEKQTAASGSEADHSREKAEVSEKRMQEARALLERKQQEWEVERAAQRDSIQQLHAARQADQRAIAALQSQLGIKKQETEQLRQRLQHQQQQHQQQQQQQQQQSVSQGSAASSSPPQQQMNVDLFGCSPSLYFDPQTHTGRLPHAPASDSSPSSFAIRLSTFQTTLNGLLCTHCLQPRFQLTQPGGLEPCGLHHPSGRMLTADGKYSCCGRVKGSVGCQPRPMHVFDFEALQREYPEFRDKCHNVRAATTATSAASTAGRADTSSMQM